jgi:hypothetical protein
LCRYLNQRKTVCCTDSTAAATPCSAQCNSINIAAGACSNKAHCFCPFFEISGSGCIQCWATVNITAASSVLSVMTSCLSQGPVTAPPAPIPPSPSATLITQPAPPTGSSYISSSSSDGIPATDTTPSTSVPTTQSTPAAASSAHFQ